MKRQLITYIMAAFSAAAILSCNKEAALDSIGSDTERTVLLTATIDAPTKAVSIDESKVVCTWEVGEKVALVSNQKVISSLEVISVDGNEAQLSGKVKGTYAEGDPMTLYYGGTDYDYSGQTGTAESAVSRAYMTAQTSIKTRSQDGKTLTLESVTMKHQQVYMGLTFYNGAERVNVKSVVITAGGKNIVKTRKPLATSPTDTLTTYGEELFTMAIEGGQDTFYFALRDTTTTDNINAYDRVYKLEIITESNDTYTGSVAAPFFSDIGNYFTDSKVILERLSPVIDAPTIHSSINYDGLKHDFIDKPAKVNPGATALYCVSDSAPSVNYEGWSETIPSGDNLGSYKVWYMVLGGEYYEDILPTKVGTTVIRAVGTTIEPPKAIGNLVANGHSQALVTPGYVMVNDTPILGADLEYYVTTADNYTPNGNEDSWSTVIPTGNATTPTTYFVWYRFRGSEYVQAVGINSRQTRVEVTMTYS